MAVLPPGDTISKTMTQYHYDNNNIHDNDPISTTMTQCQLQIDTIFMTMAQYQNYLAMTQNHNGNDTKA